MDGETRRERAPLRAEIDAALQRGATAVASDQQADGSWRGSNDAGAVFTALALALERALGVLADEHAEAGVRFLRAAQLADGSVEAWPGAGRGNHEATCFWYAGMHAADVADGDPAMVAARRAIAARGGFGRNRLVARVVLAVVGLIDPRSLPPVPIVHELIPGHDRVLGRWFGVNQLVLLHTLPALVHALRAGDRCNALDAAARRRVAAYLTARQDESGGFAGVPFYALLAALALHRLGVPTSDPRIVRAIEFSRSTWSFDERGLFVAPFHCECWDTAHALRVLGDQRDAIDRGVTRLVALQSSVPSPSDWQTPPAGAPRFGGWSWQLGNARNPDIDSTAVVLASLARHDTGDRATRHAVRIGGDWLRAMQNADGGFAAFSHGKRSPPRGALHLEVSGWRARIEHAIAEHGDPSTADVTGRVLQGLGAIGYRVGDACIDRAIEFLADHQIRTGAWWGRWAVAYLPATSYIVSGLSAVGLEARVPLMQRALAWICAQQNDDGGFGETTDAFADPERAGRGPSTVQVTAIVTTALCDAGLGATPTVPRAIAWLLARQRNDGRWVDPSCYGVIFPHRYYYRSDAFPTHLALEALHAWHTRAR